MLRRTAYVFLATAIVWLFLFAYLGFEITVEEVDNTSPSFKKMLQERDDHLTLQYLMSDKNKVSSAISMHDEVLANIDKRIESIPEGSYNQTAYLREARKEVFLRKLKAMEKLATIETEIDSIEKKLE